MALPRPAHPRVTQAVGPLIENKGSSFNFDNAMKPIPCSRFKQITLSIWLVLLTACVSFKDVNLESVMLQPGDLPSSLFAGQVDALPEDEYFAYDTAYSQSISTKSGQRAGEVRVYLFPDASERDKMYNLLTLMETSEGIIVFETPLIGDATLARQEISGSDILYINLTFVQCYAVANIGLQTTDDFVLNGNDAIVYAEKLATRLKSIACP